MDDDDDLLLVFGPQTLPARENFLLDLRDIIQNRLRWSWVVDVLVELPKYWQALVNLCPDVAGSEAKIDALISWLRDGEPLRDVKKDNLVLTPVVVLTQLVQFWSHLESTSRAPRGTDLIEAWHKSRRKQASTLGFCTGLLGAFAIASSQNEDEFQRSAAVALRLAMLVGTCVDAQEVQHQRSVSYGIVWKPSQRSHVDRVLTELAPDVYVAVVFDDNRATITLPELRVQEVKDALSRIGAFVVDAGLSGQFHSSNAQSQRYVEAIAKLCIQLPHGLQFPHATGPVLPTYSNSVGVKSNALAAQGDLHLVAVRAMLVERCNWHETFAAASQTQHERQNCRVISFSTTRCVPPSLISKLGPRLRHVTDIVVDKPAPPLCNNGDHASMREADMKGIAVVGMSIKTAGADDLEAFANMLKTGRSQHQVIGPERLMQETLFRKDQDNKRWYGNMMSDVDVFDHEFFGRSSEEAAWMDPQQRLLLHGAYQAVEQSGYFTDNNGRDTEESRREVGVYVGACAVDYACHAACHEATQYTYSGAQRGFLAGNLSKHFGWTGPSMSFDTACSASSVAIHTACQDLIDGDCSAALVGGVSVISNVLWFQNLAGASFLSPTGQCKPFDQDGDGYCRAEAIACVFLKRMSDALLDGNHILACIPATAVSQNQNCTPLFVPNAPSLSQLFQNVICKADLQPKDINVVEAHGTGTPVGDPAEYESIRAVLGGPQRSKPLFLGSVKGHVGHTEGASGLVSLIKVIMMMRQGFIPPQASFKTLSTKIQAQHSDKIEVSTRLISWDDGVKAALINNYGASGSNASMVVTMPQSTITASSSKELAGPWPFWIPGSDAVSIEAYCVQTAAYLRASPSASIADIAFHINRKTNRTLPQNVIFKCSTRNDLLEKLDHYGSKAISARDRQPAKRPVVLCFGGQRTQYIGLDLELYQSIAVLRRRLDECDKEMRAQGLGSIYPAVFSKDAIRDPISLQTALFAVQYACARCWMDCGAQVAAVTGHSFGELTALCIAGVLSLRDTIKMIVRRARAVRELWSSDAGVMVAVEAEETVVKSLVARANQMYHGDCPAGIACFNGPRAFTIAGSTEAMNRLLLLIATDKQHMSIKHKRLDVSNAFHSSLVEPLKEELERIGQGLTFERGCMHVERATESSSSELLSASFVADHMRNPVYFNHALERLAERWPSAIYLEAGFNSTITTMASRALAENPCGRSSFFQGLNVSAGRGFASLTNTTAALWEQGLSTMFWPHHPLQTQSYECLLLPPFPFKQSRHWLGLKRPGELLGEPKAVDTASDGRNKGLWTPLEISSQRTGESYRFRIETESEEYRKFFSCHVVAQTASICPATLVMSIAIDALRSLHPQWKEENLHPVLYDLANHVAICDDPERDLHLELKPLGDSRMTWEWRVQSMKREDGANAQTHVNGRIQMRGASSSEFKAEFARFERQAPYSRCLDILNRDKLSSDDDDVQILHGRSVYRALSDVVDYGEVYRHVRTVIGVGEECAGRVSRLHENGGWLDVPLSDAFSQVAGVAVNCLTDRSLGELFLAHGCEIVMRNPSADDLSTRKGDWNVYVRRTRVSEHDFMADLFAFDATDGTLVEMMIGIRFVKTAKASMIRILKRLTAGERSPSTPQPQENGHVPRSAPRETSRGLPQVNDFHTDSDELDSEASSGTQPMLPQVDVPDKLRKLLAEMIDIEPRHMVDNVMLADLGIDSLMAMEVARDIENAFACKLGQTSMMQAETFADLIGCVSAALPEMSSAAQSVGGDVPPSEDEYADVWRMAAEHVDGWETDALARSDPVRHGTSANTVLVTGATGSLGSHLVAALAAQRDTAAVVCLNRRVAGVTAEERQRQAFEKRGIAISQGAWAKLRTVGCQDEDGGLGAAEYSWAVKHVTHIVHTAWPMSAVRPLHAFAAPLRALRRLLDLARDIALARGVQVTFQLVSSIGVVGRFPFLPDAKNMSGTVRVPEERVGPEAALPNGYCQAKWVCEQLLHDTLSRHPQRFRAMVVRPGQIAGSTTSGYWNAVEHFPFMVKSAHALRAWPELDGRLQWLPVDLVARSMVELATGEASHAVYHLDHPVGQSWAHMNEIMADALHIPSEAIIPFAQWVQRVRDLGNVEANPAFALVDWLEENFERMSCGGLILDTSTAQRHSATLASAQPVSEAQARQYVTAWREMGFLRSQDGHAKG